MRQALEALTMLDGPGAGIQLKSMPIGQSIFTTMRMSCYRLWRLFTISIVVFGFHFVHLPGSQGATNHFFTTQSTNEFMVVTNAKSFNLTNEGSILLWFRADPVQPVISGAGLHAIVAKLESSLPYPFEIRFSDERCKRRPKSAAGRRATPIFPTLEILAIEQGFPAAFLAVMGVAKNTTTEDETDN